MKSHISGKFAMIVEIDFEILPKDIRNDNELKREIVKKTMYKASKIVEEFNHENHPSVTLVLVPGFINGGM